VTKNRRQTTRPGGRAQTTQPAGLNHGTPSLVSMDSPDDPQTGAPGGQMSQIRTKSAGRGDDR